VDNCAKCLVRAADHCAETGGQSNCETPRQRLHLGNVIRRESEWRGGGGWLHPSRQPGDQGTGEGWSVMISHGLEISIARGVGEKVCV